MPTEIHRYSFDPAIVFEDVEASLLLAIAGRCSVTASGIAT